MKHMFNRSYKKMVQNLLSANDDAVQLRSWRNRIVMDNASGHNLFGSGENPFVFLKDASPKKMIEQLSSAYIQHTPYSMRFYKKEDIIDIKLVPLKKTMLIQAHITPKQADIQHTQNTQLTLLTGVIHAIQSPIYMTDIQ